MNDIKETINKIIVSVLSDKITESDLNSELRLIEDLEVASIQILQIFYGIAAEFQIEIQPSEVMDLKSLGDIYSFVSRKKEIDK